MRLTLSKTEFSPGETVSGTLELEMKKPIPAEKLTLSLIYFIPTEDFTDVIEKTFVLQTLDGIREYGTSRYEFNIEIPANPPEIEFPPDSDPEMIETWKKDDALGVNCLSVLGQLDIRGQKPLRKIVDIKIRYSDI